MKPNPLDEAMSSAATMLIHETPSAMRNPVNRDGRVAGSTTFVMSTRRVAPSDRAALIRDLSTLRTPAIVLSRIAKKAEIKVMKTTDFSPSPNQRMASGIQASGGIGRIRL